MVVVLVMVCVLCVSCFGVQEAMQGAMSRERRYGRNDERHGRRDVGSQRNRVREVSEVTGTCLVSDFHDTPTNRKGNKLACRIFSVRRKLDWHS